MPDSLLPDDAEAVNAATEEHGTPEAGRPAEYVVVARRYRPQAFAELVGQQHVAQALAGAIHTHRIGHAYLFTGARGVGKTSTARIFAKSLNCATGPTDAPCNRCDICESITGGHDVDVIEIDGASNRGIDDIRQLRQNVNVRPSRARFKIYIIDEVHMLSRDAFNALLKTLEEPPEHVKFIFCTTEPEKIPITILSRCQRFDFAGIEARTIAERLRQIIEAEGVAVEPDAIDLLARRAAGSMRDGQSLLEQILAAGGSSIATADVERLLGIAADARLTTLVAAITAHDAAAVFGEVDAAVRQGVDVGQLLDQLFGYLRDLLAAAVGCPSDAFLYVSPGRSADVAALGPTIGVHTLSAMMQILEQAAWRLKQTTHGRTVVELALVRICRLDDLEDLAALAERLSSSAAASPPVAARPVATSSPPPRPVAYQDVKKNVEADVALSASGAVPPTLSPDRARALWRGAIESFHDLLADHASTCERIDVAGPGRLVVKFAKRYTLPKNYCERPEQKARLEQALSAAAGGPVLLEFVISDEAPATTASAAPRGPTKQELVRDKSQQPWIRRALELYDARIVDVLPAEAERPK